MAQSYSVYLFIGATAIALIGLKLVTQSGLTGAAGNVQNDGYAFSGAVLILIAGIMYGVLLANKRNNGKK